MKRDTSSFVELGRQPTTHTSNKKWPVEAMLRQNAQKLCETSAVPVHRVQAVLLKVVLGYPRSE